MAIIRKGIATAFQTYSQCDTAGSRTIGGSQVAAKHCLALATAPRLEQCSKPSRGGKYWRVGSPGMPQNLPAIKRSIVRSWIVDPEYST